MDAPAREIRTVTMEWLTLKVIRTLHRVESEAERGLVQRNKTYLYSTPSLMWIGFFLISSRCAVSDRLMMIDLPGGRVSERSSSVSIVSWKTSVQSRFTVDSGYKKTHLWTSRGDRSTRHDTETGFPSV